MIMNNHDHDILMTVLSEGELETLTYAANGMTNAEIAEKLHVEVTTIKARMNRVYDKWNLFTPGKRHSVNRVRAALIFWKIRSVFAF
jgi:DNA-binding NarL/FixJ family response regulator